MTITLRIALQPDARAVLARDPALADALDLSALVLELDAGDPRFRRLLEATRNTSGVWLNPMMRFTPAETAQARFFQVECRGKIVRETQRDNDLNRARIDALDFHRDDGRSLGIKLIDCVALSKISLAPNAVGCATDWMAEFIVPAGVANVFEGEGLTGFELRPAIDGRTGQAHAGYFLLHSLSIMPDAEHDLTTIDQRTDPTAGGWRELGCLTYALMGSERLSDFNRTSEDWSNNNMPVWVVTDRVRRAFQKHRLKGWGFRPVLQKGTPLHQAYITAWTELLELMAMNPRNTF